MDDHSKQKKKKKSLNGKVKSKRKVNWTFWYPPGMNGEVEVIGMAGFVAQIREPLTRGKAPETQLILTVSHRSAVSDWKPGSCRIRKT